MQKLQLSIPEPCHENWQQMTPTDQGRFCNACAKEVVDFSMMTDMQVLNYFSTLTHEKVCGRALPDQLNRTISRAAEPKKRLFWYWNYIVMFCMFFGKGNVAKAQGGMKTTTEFSPVKANEISKALAGKVGEVVQNDSRIISGRITDIDGNPVSFASVKIKDTYNGVAADKEGNFSIKINDRNCCLEISALGYDIKEVDVNNFKAQVIILNKIGGLLSEVVINSDISLRGKIIRYGVTSTVVYTKRNWMADTLKTLGTKINGTIKIYPNPVQRGNTFNLSLKLKQTGLYQIQITDATGRSVLQKQINVITKEFTEKILADNRWSSGVYYISIIDNKNKLVNKSSFILQ